MRSPVPGPPPILSHCKRADDQTALCQESTENSGGPLFQAEAVSEAVSLFLCTPQYSYVRFLGASGEFTSEYLLSPQGRRVYKCPQ